MTIRATEKSLHSQRQHDDGSTVPSKITLHVQFRFVSNEWLHTEWECKLTGTLASVYRIARNFRRIQFLRMGYLQSSRDLIFADIQETCSTHNIGFTSDRDLTRAIVRTRRNLVKEATSDRTRSCTSRRNRTIVAYDRG